MPAKEKSRRSVIISSPVKFIVYSIHLCYAPAINAIMNIYINNKPQQVSCQPSIADVLATLDIASQKGIAIAINNNVIPRAEWTSHALQDEDKIILIKATQGG